MPSTALATEIYCPKAFSLNELPYLSTQSSQTTSDVKYYVFERIMEFGYVFPE